MRVLLRGLLIDESGQDLLEYALLSAFIGLAGFAALNAIGVSIFNYFGASQGTINSQWQSPPPTGS